MPIYSYKCNTCDTVFDELVMSSDDEVLCPNCKTFDLKRLVTNCNHQFKCDGFYHTDYGKGKKKPTSSTKVSAPALDKK